MNKPMDRLNLRLTKPQAAALRAFADADGLTVAELVRRVLDAYLNRKRK